MGSKTSKSCKDKGHETVCQTAEGIEVCHKCCDKIKHVCFTCKTKTEEPHSVIRFSIPYGMGFRGVSGLGPKYCYNCASQITDFKVDFINYMIYA